jgi:dephospho-CoA kinase
MKRIGLTGGIASGKSAVGKWFEQHGIPVWDADTAVHTLLNTDKAIQQQLKMWFGEAVILPDGKANRPLMGERVFTDTLLKKQLEGLLHPLVRFSMEAFFADIEQSQPTAPFAIAMIPLLFENGLQAQFDAVWVVNATQAQQIERMKTHRGMDEGAIRARLASQLPLAEKIALADVVINNTGTLEALYVQLEGLLSQFNETLA